MKGKSRGATPQSLSAVEGYGAGIGGSAGNTTDEPKHSTNNHLAVAAQSKIKLGFQILTLAIQIDWSALRVGVALAAQGLLMLVRGAINAN